MKISALVLAKDEQEMIADCLRQLEFADEIIVLDQNSQDRTVAIAKRYTDKIFKTTSWDFSKNRNYLKDLAQNMWLFYIDADERIDQAQVEKIKEATDGPYSAYYFPRKNFILGKWLKHGGWWPDYVPRLFKKDKLIGWMGPVHESPKIEGEFAYIDLPIKHLSARTVSQMFTKTIKWAKIEAELFYKANHRKVTVLRVLRSMLTEFVNRFFIKKGFFDGKIGLVQSVYQSLHWAIIFVYLWEIQNKTQVKLKKMINE